MIPIRIAVVALSLIFSSTLTAQVITVDSPVNPGMPVIGFAANYGAGLESQSPFRVKVFLTQSVNMDVIVNYSVTGSAQNGQDFYLAQNLLTIAAGETSGVIQFPIVDDASVEGDETVNIILSNPQNAVLGQSVFTYVIKRNDHDLDTPPPPPVLTMIPGEKSVTLQLSSTYPQEIRVDYQITITETGSGYTHNLTAGTVTIPSGQMQTQIDIPDFNDNIELKGVATTTVYLNNAVNVTLNNPMLSVTR